MPKKIEQWFLLDGKQVVEDALPELEYLRELIPEKLHGEFEKILEDFKAVLVECDVHDYYQERGDS